MTHEADVTTAVERLLEQHDPVAAVELLRVVNGASETGRRLALDKLDTYLRARPDERPRAIVDALIALRRAR